MQKPYLYALIGVGIVLVGGVFVVWSKRIQQPPNEHTQAGEDLVTKELRATSLTEERDHVLSRAKITGVTDKEGPYKQVTVSNPATVFSFEVPDTWLTETRNSGEVELNEEELREFFATNYFADLRDDPDGLAGSYWDFTWNALKGMSFDEMKAAFASRRTDGPGYPHASVCGGKYIGYMGQNQDQVDFYVLSTHDAKKYYRYDGNALRIFGYKLSSTLVGDLKAKEMMIPPNTGLYGAGNVWVFVPLQYSHHVLVIKKQGYSDEFNSADDHLMKTFRLLKPNGPVF